MVQMKIMMMVVGVAIANTYWSLAIDWALHTYHLMDSMKLVYEVGATITKQDPLGLSRTDPPPPHVFLLPKNFSLLSFPRSKE